MKTVESAVKTAVAQRDGYWSRQVQALQVQMKRMQTQLQKERKVTSAVVRTTGPVNPWYLSTRQIQVLQAVAATGSRLGAAQLLGLSENTIKSHLMLAAKKMQTESTLESVVTAMRSGLIR